MSNPKLLSREDAEKLSKSLRAECGSCSGLCRAAEALEAAYERIAADERDTKQQVYDWLAQTISGIEEDEGWVRLADVLAALPNTGNDSLWFKGSEWQEILNERESLRKRIAELEAPPDDAMHEAACDAYNEAKHEAFSVCQHHAMAEALTAALATRKKL